MALEVNNTHTWPLATRFVARFQTRKASFLTPHFLAFLDRAALGANSIQPLVIILALLAVATPAVSQTALMRVEKSAEANAMGRDEACENPSKRDGDRCVDILAPENAYLTNQSYGNGWDCHFGFEELDDGTCLAVVVPKNGYLGSFGERWHCLRGYRKVDESCQKIDLPQHSYLAETSQGSEWLCDRGFTAVADECLAIAVPENGYLNGRSYGTPWSCERGYLANGQLCEAVVIPPNAFFDDATYGNGWKCERGYSETDADCQLLKLPENAHLDRSGNAWSCNQNFYRSRGLCVLRN